MKDHDRLIALATEVADLTALLATQRMGDLAAQRAAFAVVEKSAEKTEQSQHTYNVQHNDLLRKMDDQYHYMMPRKETEAIAVTITARIDTAAAEWIRSHNELVGSTNQRVNQLIDVDNKQALELTDLRASVISNTVNNEKSKESTFRNRNIFVGLLAAVLVVASITVQGWAGWQAHRDRTSHLPACSDVSVTANQACVK